MTKAERLFILKRLGNLLRWITLTGVYFTPSDEEIELSKKLQRIIDENHHFNLWFDPFHVKYSLSALGLMLDETRLENWANRYIIPEDRINRKTIAVVCAGNIPAVGFHDFLCVLVSGHNILVKLSSDDLLLLPWFSEFLHNTNPEFKNIITITEGTISGFDAVIATGSNNTSRYFEYYFGKYPHIFRRNMNSIAILDGQESPQELSGLVDDILIYYGRGCRNVSFLLVPENYDFSPLLDAFRKYSHYAYHSKFYNNYEYNKAVMLVNRIPFYDIGFMLLTSHPSIQSPLAVIHYQTYKKSDEIYSFLHFNRDKIQCNVSHIQGIPIKVDFGKSQQPALDDYADGVDTMKFLENL
ncbi:MAG: acyl-CoA reductase [Bacteroidales bacterium]|nr:acyl-CoA reductase [Bacteroidota bacterium]NMD15273.1 acyl-CoA reductase [Bacteroidales bacterium]HPL33325.1 hypothetical protein [Bacteroidales bacterium]HQI50767.1 hypothetical protein [Bacteroidales bacterium]